MMRRRSRKRILKWLLWIFGVLAVALLTLYVIKIDDVVMAQGIVDPGQKIYIDSPLSRVLQEIICPPGTAVKAGQPVAQLYNGDLKATVSTAITDLRRAEANLEESRARLALLEEMPTPEELKIAESRVEQARITLKARQQELSRAEHLYLGERLWSQEDLERARTSLDLAQANLRVATENYNLVKRGASPAQLRQAEAAVLQAEVSLDKARHTLEADRHNLSMTTLRSPADGIVARQDLYPGMLAGQGKIVMIIAGGSGDPIISAWVHETNAWKVRLGQQVEILSNLFADREEFVGLGEVSKLYGYATQEGGSRTFELEVQVVETPLPLKYGSTADLRVIVGQRSIFKILFGIEEPQAIQSGRQDHGLSSQAARESQPLPAAGAGSPDVANPPGTPASGSEGAVADTSASQR